MKKLLMKEKKIKKKEKKRIKKNYSTAIILRKSVKGMAFPSRTFFPSEEQHPKQIKQVKKRPKTINNSYI